VKWRWKTAPGARAEEIDQAWRRSLRAVIAGDWPAAETWLERIVGADSKDLDAVHALARLYRQQGAVGRSLRMHQNLLLRSDLDRTARVEALFELARDFEAGGYNERAAATYEEILATQSRNVEALERLASLLFELKEFPRALALVRRLRRRNRELGDRLEVAILLSQAQVLREEGDHEGARRSIKRCLRRDKTCGPAWTLLGELEVDRGKSAKALAAWKRGAAIDETVAPALYPKIAASFAARGKPEDFDQYLLKLTADRPFDNDAQIVLARVRAGRGDTSQAVEILARALEIAPENLGLQVELGRLLMASGQDAEALKAYSALLDALERDAISLPPETSR
jgi:lipopolysaccharide biosynthesis regulator YciM